MADLDFERTFASNPEPTTATVKPPRRQMSYGEQANAIARGDERGEKAYAEEAAGYTGAGAKYRDLVNQATGQTKREGAAPAAPQAEEAETVPVSSYFRVVEALGDEPRRVYRVDDFGEPQDLGEVTLKDADEVLKKLAVYDEEAKAWDVPEDVALQLVEGRLPLPEYLKTRYRKGEAGVVGGLYGDAFLRGKLSAEDAVAKGDPELVGVQLKEAPLFAWQGDFGSTVARMWDEAGGLSGLGRRAAGGIAEMAPGALAGMREGVEPALILGGGSMAALGPLAGTPQGVLTVGAALGMGQAIGVYQHISRVEGGQTAIHLLKKGVEPKTAQNLAIAAGAIKGVFEALQFDLLTAPMQRWVVSEVLPSEAVKKTMSHWFANYTKETGGEIGVEELQASTDLLAALLAAEIQGDPNIAPTRVQAADELVNTLLESTLSMGALKAPGAAMEGLASRGAAPVAGKAEAAESATAASPATGSAASAAPGSPAATPAATPAAPAAQAASAAPADPLGDLIGKFEAGEASAEEVVGAAAKMQEEAAAEPKEPKEPKAPKPTLEQQTRDLEVDARIKALETKKGDTERVIKELERVQKKYEQPGFLRSDLDRRIEALQGNIVKFDEELDFLKANSGMAMVEPGDSLEMKPAALESIVAEGFKEGTKQSQGRAKDVLAIAKAAGLTGAEVRTLLHNKLVGAMSDAEYQNWLEGSTRKDSKTGEMRFFPGFKDAVAQVVETKQARAELDAVRKDKKIKRETYVRQLHDLPPIRKMTVEQMKAYGEILKSYDTGDEALPPKRVKALETTPLKGARTKGEARAKIAEHTGRPVEDFENARVSPLDLGKYDSLLAGAGAFQEALVTGAKVALAKGDVMHRAFKQKLDALAADAIASRRKNMKLGQRVADWLAPQQKALMAFIEEADPVKRGALAEVLTPEELALGEFILEFNAGAEDYLIKTGALAKDGRFSGAYLFHTKRPLSEVLRDFGAGKETAWGVVKDIVGRALALDEQFHGDGRPASAVGLRKFMRQTLYRSGKLTPSANVVRATKLYAQDFHRKVALDAAVPYLDTLARVTAADADPRHRGEVREATRQIVEFTGQWLNAKKGNARQAVFGGGLTGELAAMAEPTIRFFMGLVSFKFIALNAPLQVMSAVGEGTALYMHLGEAGLARAAARKLTKQGQAILEKPEYAAFVGESPFEQASEAGRTAEDHAKLIMFGAFQLVRKSVMEAVLLGNMTEAEFKAGKMSGERMAALKLEAGRWMDVHGSKSVLGSTVFGASWAQFKGWAVPPFHTVRKLAVDFAKSVAGQKTLTPEQKLELMRLSMIAGTAALVAHASGEAEDRKDDSFVGQALRYLRRELLSPFASFSPSFWVTAGVSAAYAEKLAQDLDMLVTLEKYAEGSEKEGKLKGLEALKRDAPVPRVVTQALTEEEDD